ncbi:MAG: DUF6492 family protein [Pseudohongiellaceae bacterium]
MTEPARMASLPLLLTVTWSGDRAHFALLRESLKRSALADCPHLVIVHDEDLPLFKAFREPGLTLCSSAAVLPALVERRRFCARRQQERWGRRATTVAGSLARRFGWPRWVRYTGWHTQQLCKLAAVAGSDARTVVAMDSDLIVTPHARVEDFLPARPDHILCYEDWQPAEALSRKVEHWQTTACRLLDLPLPEGDKRDVYYDTPFVFDVQALQSLLGWLDERYGRPWWETLIDCPPRQWSEFGLYRAWLRHRFQGQVEWTDRSRAGYLYDASDADQLARELRELVEARRCHYVTIHSQSNGRHDWHPDDYADQVRALLSGA